MSSPLSAEEKAEFTRIIDAILATADLNTVSRKKVRDGLEAALDRDLSEQKHAIKSLIEARFDAISNNFAAKPPSVNGYRSNGTSADPDPDADAGADANVDADMANGEKHLDAAALPPASKKFKREESAEDADARLAAELQAQENRLARGRTTRGGSSTASKVTKKAKPAKKKSAKRVRSDDEDGSEAEPGKEKRKASGGFQKPFNLSYTLADLLGETQLPRPQVVKKLWEHIKSNDLQDPTDKRQIRCDDKMQAVFKVTRVDMFQMNKLLGNHLYPIEE